MLINVRQGSKVFPFLRKPGVIEVRQGSNVAPRVRIPPSPELLLVPTLDNLSHGARSFEALL